VKKNLPKSSTRSEKPRRLILSRETIQALDEPLLKNAEGGAAALPTTSYPADGGS
jgi:hypothetical protein